MTIGPVNPGHAMVLPKAHVPLFGDLPEEDARHLFSVTQRTAAALRASGLRCEGVNLWLSDGEAAFQDVFHFHLHVFPRWVGDRFRIEADWEAKPSRDELDANAKRIREAYAQL